MVDNTIYEPLKLYKSRYEQEVKDATKDYLDSLIKESKVDVELNRATVKKFNTAQADADKAHQKLSSIKTLKVFIVIFSILFLIAAAVLIFMGVETKNYALYISLGVVAAVLGIAGFISLPVKVNKVIKDRSKVAEKKQAKADKLKEDCYGQVAPLLSLFDWGMPQRIVEKVTPIIQLDDYFDAEKFDYLYSKYKFGSITDPTISTLGVVSGSLVDNPFLMIKNLHQTWTTKTYTGSIIITWTETVTDDEGHSHTVTRTQTLVASVSKPYPAYFEHTELVYANDACPKLKFSRVPSSLKNGEDKTVDKYVDKMEKEIDKMADKALKNGKSFTPMNNLEFEALFHAFDRNNEREFRMMFSPLAQQNICDLIKDDEYYGDDFKFRKQGCLNFLDTEHIQNKDFSGNPAMFYSHDIDRISYMFNGYMNDYFKNLYFALAPILSVPLYQTYKPEIADVKKVYSSNLSTYENEAMANGMGANMFLQGAGDVKTIVKVTGMEKVNNADRVKIKAHSFEAIPRIELVPRMGGDGRLHEVPVTWYEYLPIEKDGEFYTKAMKNHTKDINDRLKGVNNNSQINIGEKLIYNHGILAFIARRAFGVTDDNEIDKMFCYNKK